MGTSRRNNCSIRKIASSSSGGSGSPLNIEFGGGVFLSGCQCNRLSAGPVGTAAVGATMEWGEMTEEEEEEEEEEERGGAIGMRGGASGITDNGGATGMEGGSGCL